MRTVARSDKNRKEENIGGVAVKGQKRCFRALFENTQYVRKAAVIPFQVKLGAKIRSARNSKKR